MVQSFTRTGFAVVCTSWGSDANSVRLTGKEFEVYFNFASLTGRSAKWYIDCIQTQLNLENLIFQASQTPAAGKNLKPYQGLKRKNLNGTEIGFCRKKPKTLSGIETIVPPRCHYATTPEKT
jgi:hypothetical protein